MKQTLGWIPTTVAVAAAVALMSSPRPAAAQDSPSFNVYGFAHFDYIQDFNRVDPAWAATLRPSKIPTISGLYGSDGQAILSARQTRFGVQGTLPTDAGDVYTKFEFDLYGVGPDAGLTTIRFRHGYGEWKGILAGQTNTLFMDADMIPNVIDYWAPPGIAFVRNPQLRYTRTLEGGNSFAVAIEHPNGDIDVGQIRDFDPALAAGIQADNKWPDFTAAFRIAKPWGHFRLAGIARRLGYDTANTPGNSPHGSVTGAGLDASLLFKYSESSKIMLSGVFGNGLANYMNDGGMDVAPGGTIVDPEAKAVPLQGFSAYVDHFWNPKLSSTVGYSRTQVDNQTLQAGDAFRSGDYASANIVCYPTKNVFFGIEGLYGRRTDNSGAFGEDRRIQVSGHYNFSSLDFK